MDTAQWPQEIVVKPIEDIVVTNTCPKPLPPTTPLERKPRPQKEQALNCPRCHSTNTKFCYYNNYSLTQPRYFCKTCRRYWTEGGSLRNIPVGGGSRKNKRPNSSSSSSSSKNIKLHDDLVTTPNLPPQSCTTQNPKVHHDGQDLNLGFPNINELVHQNNNNNKNNNVSALTCSSSTTTTATTTVVSASQLSALELITGLTSSSRGLNYSFMPMPVPNSSDPNGVYTCGGFPMQDFKPSLNFSLLDGIGSGYASLHGVQGGTSSGRLLFPFEDLKQVGSTNTTMDQNSNKEQQQGDDSNGYWSGLLGGGAGSW